jgi:hypothetical protein
MRNDNSYDMEMVLNNTLAGIVAGIRLSFRALIWFGSMSDLVERGNSFGITKLDVSQFAVLDFRRRP